MPRTVKHVLLIEDNPVHAALIRGHLRDFIGLAVHWVRCAEEAFNHLELSGHPTDGQPPDLVLLDLRLPGRCGAEILNQLKADERFRQIPVVVLTTSDDDSDVSLAYAAHANGYLVKSPDPDKLRDMLHQTVSYWCSWNRLPEPAAR